MNPLGLSPEAKERRKAFLTASDAKPIMEGAWPELWRRKMGRAEEENLDNVLRVQMGSFTEPFNLWWYQKQTGRTPRYYSDNPVCRWSWEELTGEGVWSEWAQSAEYPWMGCSLDATSTTSKGHACVLDAKHVGTYRYDELVERYTPSMTHQAVVVGVDWWALSVFVGNGRWELVEQAVDPFYREELIEREREFWGWVQRGEEPPDMTSPAAAPKPQPRLRTVEMPPMTSDAWKAFVANQNWAVDVGNAIEQFSQTEGAHKAYEAARGIINKTLPDTVGVLTLQTVRGTFTAKRSSNGALVMKMEKSNA